MGRTGFPTLLSCLMLLSMSPVVFSQTPIVSLSQATYAAVPGGSVTLSCTATSSSAITTVLWLLDRGGLSTTISSNGGKYTGASTTNPSLTINSLTNDDTGSYRCLAAAASGGFGQSGTTYLTVATVNAFPVVQHPAPSYSILAGSTVMLGCIISANPASTTVVWTKTSGANPTIITVDGSKYINGNTATPSLTISGLGPSDAGTYVCQASNAFGSATSTGTTLTVTGNLAVLSVTTPVSTTTGSSVTLQCNIDSASPAVTSVFWSFTPASGGTATTITSSTSGYSGATTGSPSLVIISTSSASAGNYVCNAQNAIGTAASQAVVLTVTGSPPVLSVSTPVTITAGSPATLQCNIVSANPAVTSVFWSFTPTSGGTATTITSSTSGYSGATTGSPSLVIQNPSSASSGNYVCNAGNAFGTGSSQAVIVTVTGSPVLSVTTPVSITAGSSVTLQCNIASANPAVTSVFWSFTPASGGTATTITSSTSGYSGATSGSPSLVIFSTSSASSGNYVCNAVNAIGTGSSQAVILTVTGSLPVLSVSTPVTITAGSPTTLQCNIVSANPAVTSVFWSFTPTSGGTATTITSSTSGYSGATTGSPSLVIQNPSSASSGNYVCNAGNAFGTGSSQAVIVTVTGSPVLSVTTPVSITAGSSVTLQCNIASANPAVTSVFWSFTPASGGTATTITSSTSGYSGATSGSPSLVIFSTSSASSGNYVCNAVNAIGTGSSQAVILTVTGSLPVLSVSTPVTITAGSPTTLQCNIVSANPAVTSVFWSFTPTSGGTATTITSSTSGYSGATTGSPSLVIQNPSSASSGNYVCNAGNAFGTGSSQAVIVTVTGSPVLSVTTPVSTAAGSSVTLQCNIDSANPAVTSVFWSFTPASGGTATTITSGTSGYSGATTGSPSLVILNPSSTSAGNYVCNAGNAIGVGSSQAVILTVTGSLPVLSVSTPVSITTGSSVTLQCNIVSANPAVTSVFWSFTPASGGTATTITSSTSGYSGATTGSPSLVIQNPSSASSGNYVCNAGNAFGTGSSQAVIVTVTGSPVLSVTTPVSTAAGSSVTLQCNIDSANPAVTSVFWSFTPASGGTATTITSGTSGYSGATTGSPSLVILNPSSTSAGNYVCNAGNAIGVGSSQAVILTVTGSLPVLSVSTPVSITTGSSVTLQCNIVSANPAVTSVFWSFTPASGGTATTITSGTNGYSGATTGSPSLVILSPSSASSGNYVCNAGNAFGTGSSQAVIVTVTGSAPSVSIGQNAYSATTGQPITLVCNVNANPFQTSVTWEMLVSGVYQQVSISTNGRYSGGTTTTPSLTITTSQVLDSGTYRCSAANQVGSATSGTTQLTISGSAPSVTIGQNAYSATTGGSITLVCNVNANPFQTSVTWEMLVSGVYQQVSISTNGRYSGGTTTTPSLTITTSQVLDSGTYRCSAANQVGSATSGTTQLTISGSAPSVTIGQNTYSATTGGSITLVCNVNANPFQTSVTWEMLVSGVYQQVSISTNGRYSGGTTTTPSLIITNSQPSDSGTYRCSAVNQVGSATSGTTQLTISGSVPSVTIGQNAYSATTGGSITLVCNVNANPFQTSVTWEMLVSGVYQPVSISTNGRYSGGTTTTPSLTITTSQVLDSGTYRCSAANQVGSATSGTTQLTISGSAPSVTIGQNTYSATTGGSITLVCNVNANPFQTSVTWEMLVSGVYQQVSISTNGRYSGGTTTTPSLIITNSQPSDSGTYRCSAANQVGSATSGTTQLTISGSAPSVTIGQNAYSATTGGSITLVCNVNANPFQTSVTWEMLVSGVYQPVSISTNGRYSGGTTTTPSLTITTSQVLDSGTYRCSAANQVGSATSGTTQLTISGSAPSVTIGQNAYSTTTGTPITLVCNVNANPFQTSVTWEILVSSVYQPVSINTNSRYSGGTTTMPSLIITNSQPSDSGTYRCSATNQVGSATSGTTQLTISGAAPSVSIGQNAYSTTTGTPITLVCNVNANPFQTSVTWEMLVSGVYQAVSISTNGRYSGGTTTTPSLTITTSQVLDSGTYRCSAANQVGSATSGTTQLTVSGAVPVLSIGQSAPSVVSGSNAVLQCSIVSANPSVQSVFWTFTPTGGTQATQLTIDNSNYMGPTTTNPSLTVINANSADAGSYVCHAVNSVGTGNSGTITLAITGSAPSVTIGQNAYSATTGGPITLVCNVNANPFQTSVTWEILVSGVYQPVSISTNSRYSGGTTTMPSLIITNSQPSDSGTYRCSATNQVGSATSGTTQLTITGSLPSVTIGQNAYSTTTGGTSILVCNVNANPFQTSVTWEMLVSNAYQQVSITTNSRYSGGTPSTPTLTITNSQPSDSGTYRCSAANAVGSASSTTTQLTVTGNVPLVDITLTTYSVVTADAITIPCSVTSDPAHTLATWQHTVNGQLVTINAASSGGKYSVGPLNSPSLTITGAQSSDQGVYTCTAFNSVGSGQDSTTLTVTGSIPVVTIPMSGYSVQTGSPITIPCNIGANPSITAVSWRRVQGTASTPLDINGSTFTGGSVTTPALTIPNANQQTHQGFYVCTATNAVGTGSSGTIFVSVTGAIPTVTVQQTPATATVGTSVTLQCVVTADPIATIVEWTRAGSTTAINVAANSKYTGASPSNPSLTIVTTDNADAGAYTCSATNAIGKGTSGQVTLTVTGSAPVVTVAQTTYSVITGAPVTLQCSATGNPAVTMVTWQKVSSGQTTELTVSSGQFSVSNPSLVIAAAGSGDAGTYTCKAVNSVGAAQSQPVMVTVSGAVPSVMIGAPTYTAVTGSSTTLQCTVTGTPAASVIRWSKTTSAGTTLITVDGTKYQGSVQGSPSLVINSASSSDEGTYVCRATNVVGTGVSGQTVLSVIGSIPNVQVTQPSYSVIKGGTITLECTVSGLPAATSVVWKRTSGGTETTVSTTAAKYSGSTPTTPSLTITGAASVDAATYVCTASNSVGLGQSGQTSLSVTGDIPTVTVPTLTYSAVSGSSVTLDCVVSASPPIDSVQWKKIQSTVSTNVDVSLAAYTGGTTGNPSLTIVTATATNMADYICTATNSVGIGESGRTTLTVTGAVPTVTIPASSYSVITGQNIDIPCNVVASPTASSISWTKIVGTVTSVLNIDNTKFTGGNIQTPTLTIHTAGSNDQASYTCTATNVVGSATSNAAVLTVTGGLPAVTIENPDITAVLGSSVTIICKVTATPQATTISWKRTIGGTTTPITINTKFVGSTVTNPSLTINTVAASDQGRYVCVAQNTVGEGQSSAGTLTVTGNKPSVVISQPTYTVITGEDITIDCDFTASPDATALKWRKIVNTVPTDITLTGSTKYTGGTLTSPSLVIKAATSADQSFYQCVVTNPVGDGLSVTAYLFVTGAIPTATVTQTSYNIELAQSVTIGCNVAGVPDVQSVSWTVTKPPSTTATPIIINAPKYSGGSVSTPSLTIADVALADKGVYKCKATNILGTGDSANVYLTVVGTAPSVSVPVSAFTVDSGGSVVLLCSIVASPAVTRVYWTRSVNGAVNQITAAAPKYEGSVPSNPSLKINNLISADEGSYRCHAENTVSSGQSELTTLVVAVAPTNIRINPAAVTRREQQEFVSTCMADANPAPTYQWMKKSTQQVVSNIQTLTILNLDRGHHGEYICTATNSRGSATATLNVDIQYAPISTVTTAEQTVVLGMNDPRTLTCNTIANPAVETYRWTKGNVNIAGATGLTHVATITSATDYGTYSCYATNSIGQSSSINFLLQSGAVTVTPTLAPTDAPLLTTEMIIAIAVAIAVFLLILIIICVICCSRANHTKVEKVYTRKPTPAPMMMAAPPMMMREPSMAVVPMNNSARRYYDNGYSLGRSDLPQQEYTFYESERAKDRPSSFVNFSGE